MTQNRIEIAKKLISKRVKDLGGSDEVSLDYLKTDLRDELRPEIEKIAELFGDPPVNTDTYRETYSTALKEYLSLNPVTVETSNSLVKNGYLTWLTKERKKQIQWNYSDRYFTYLEKKGRAEKVLNENREACEDILGKMGDPLTQQFFNRGLVVGSVQSGKTENFNGVINHAIDAGYRLIIVFSGIMEDLRSQTQKRIESDVIGRGILDEEKDTKGKKGVGHIVKFGAGNDAEQVNSITSYKADFNRSLLDADFSLDNLNLLVCKKNVSILKNLLIWLDDCLLDDKDAFDIPLLIVDDEADNASLNNLGSKGREYATKINGHIRALLALFNRRAYLGYTATPFANVLQDRNDIPSQKWVIDDTRNQKVEQREFSQVGNLFPDDFIVLLNPPTNYIGAKAIFETVEPIENENGEKLPVVHSIDDYVSSFPPRIDLSTNQGIDSVTSRDEFDSSPLAATYPSYSVYKQSTRAAKRDDPFPETLPRSLKEAALCFILTIAVRENRKPDIIHSQAYCPHHTMLVHTSRFIPWQVRTRDLIKSYVEDISSRLLAESPEDPESVYRLFEKIWYKYYAEVVSNIWDFLPTGYADPYLVPVTFKSVLSFLESAATGISVKALNSGAKDSLHYNDKNPTRVIAVGGNRLSRGFTLEGLTVNYFLRTAGCADSLLQMGRWFGYRPGYLDCCKLFTTPDLVDRFDLTTRTIEELEGEFRKMEASSKSPREFELRVRKHPGALKITRPSILKNATEVKWSYQDQLVQTTRFSITRADILKGWEQFRRDVIYPNEFSLNAGFWTTELTGLAAAELVGEIPNLDSVTRNSVKKFVELAMSQGRKLDKWKIAIKDTGTGRTLTSKTSKLPFDVTNLAIRRGPKANTNFRDDFVGRRKLFHATGRNRNIVSSGKDLSLFLSDDQIREAESSYRAERADSFLKKNPELTPEQAAEKAGKTTIPERAYREKMSDQHALILIYLLDTRAVFLQEEGAEDPELTEIVEAEGIDLDIPLVGYAIGFPPIHPDPGGTYMTGDYSPSDEDEDDIGDEDAAIPDDLSP